ncbi:hypothetical protein [Psychrobacter sp. WY6]|uniref:hypothetical protein n=1 Tax=Psychrobacter sp. WY6 TaxID=2708350 RepID=UPI002022DDBB|nr:hypothetical protein [Psychrobacter sp. WY6]
MPKLAWILLKRDLFDGFIGEKLFFAAIRKDNSTAFSRYVLTAFFSDGSYTFKASDVKLA